MAGETPGGYDPNRPSGEGGRKPSGIPRPLDIREVPKLHRPPSSEKEREDLGKIGLYASEPATGGGEGVPEESSRGGGRRRNTVPPELQINLADSLRAFAAAQEGMIRLFGDLAGISRRKIDAGEGISGVEPMGKFDTQLAISRGATMLEQFYYAYAEGKDAEGKEDAARNLLENLLRAIEADDADIKQEEIAGLRQAINAVFAGNHKLREELAEKAHARSYLHMGAYTAKYLGGEATAGVITQFLPWHLSNILDRTKGVRRAKEILEEPDKGAKGGYYRKAEAEPDFNDEAEAEIAKNYQDMTDEDKKEIRQKIWLVRQKFKLFENPQPEDQDDQVEPTLSVDTEQFKTDKKDVLLKKALFLLDQINEATNKNYTPEAVAKLLAKDPRFAILIGDPAKMDELEKQFKQAKDQLEKAAEAKNEAEQERIKQGMNALGERNKQLLQTREAFQQLLYENTRAFALAERLHHIFGESSIYDGPRWKQGVIVPQGMGEAGGLILLNPTQEWEDPGDPKTEQGKGTKIILNFRTDAEKELEYDHLIAKSKKALAQSEQAKTQGDQAKADRLAAKAVRLKMEASQYEVVARTMKNLRKRDSPLISQAWTRAKRGLYTEHWDQIDFDVNSGSLSGRGAYELKKLFNNPVVLHQEGEPYPGKAVFLRRFTDLGIPSLAQAIGYAGIEQVIRDWLPNFKKMSKGWAPRLAKGEKFKSFFTREELNLLNSSSNLQNPIEAWKKIKEHAASYMVNRPGGEADEYNAMWTGAIIEFNAHHAEEIGLRRADIVELNNMITLAHIDAGSINAKTAEELRLKYLGTPFSRDVRLFIRMVNWLSGLWAALMEAFKQAGKGIQ